MGPVLHNRPLSGYHTDDGPSHRKQPPVLALHNSPCFPGQLRLTAGQVFTCVCPVRDDTLVKFVCDALNVTPRMQMGSGLTDRQRPALSGSPAPSTVYVCTQLAPKPSYTWTRLWYARSQA